MIWTDELCKLIHERAAAGISGSAIAAELRALGHDATKNAVVGKAHRLGFTLSGAGGRPAIERKRKPAPAPKPAPDKPQLAMRPASITPAKILEEPRETIAAESVIVPIITAHESPKFGEAPAKRIPLAKLHSKNCHWPLGDFADRPPYLFCGDIVFVGCYCRLHYEIATGHKETKNVYPRRADAA